jgi:Na+-driven multidrug efflux pump
MRDLSAGGRRSGWDCTPEKLFIEKFDGVESFPVTHPSMVICIAGNALAIAVSYSSTIFAGATLIWLFNLLMAVVRGTGNLRVPAIVVCGGALVLVPLSPALIFGVFSYPGLGPSGGAVAMLVYYALGTLAYAAYLWGRFGVLKPSFRVPKLSLASALAILRVGGMSAVVLARTNLTLAIVTVYVGMSGIEA